MELREYIVLFRGNIRWFLVTIALFVLASLIWQKNQSVSFEATLLLNIGRTSMQDTQEYTYDSFYRLQADERFADTVVRWLSSPRIAEDIYRSVGIDTDALGTRELGSVFSAKRLSSQMIEVKYTRSEKGVLQKISSATIDTLNRYTRSLNEENSEKNWFLVIGSDPVIRETGIRPFFALLGGLVMGTFFGFWVALGRRYLSESKQNK